MADLIPLRRDQLAKFLPDEETIRRFENLFKVVSVETPTNVLVTDLDAGSALSIANSALEELEELKEYFENSLNNFQYLELLQEIEDLKNNIAPSFELVDSLNDLSNVVITAPTNGQVLKYNTLNGDWENGAASGGSATYSVTLSVTPAKFDEVIINVIDANSTALSYISCFLVPNADNDLDDLIGVDVKAEAKAGSIDFMLHSDGAIVGDYQVVYQILG
jgi:hypothetical protein